MMKRSSIFILSLIGSFIIIYILLGCRNSESSLRQEDASILAIYRGNSPCGGPVRSLLNIPLTKDCDRISWTITFYQEPNTKAPTTYQLSYTYGLQGQGPGFVNGGTEGKAEGKWKITRGTKNDKDAVVYQLDPENAKKYFSFLKLDDHILQLLHKDKSLMIGDASFSYTLNRLKK